jgi:Big-like domain-containing protein
MNRRNVLVAAAITAALAVTSPAHAALLDHGPQHPTLVFPQWYRDLNGLALQPCLTTTASPNGVVGSMCFPFAPNPNGFAGNVGAEIFYNDLVVDIGKGAAAQSATAFAMRYIASLEGSYLPLGVPVHGTEIAFGRIRIVMNVQVPGTYKVTHPFGVEVFPDVQPGPRGVFFTVDVPLGPAMDFDAALTSRIGPFVQWDFVDAGLSLDVTNAAGALESYVGDPNFFHTFTGSPFGTNYVRVDGPPGSNISGIGDDFVQSPLGTVLGQKWTAPIPTPLNVKRATYLRDPARSVIGIDVFATSAPNNQMIVTGTGLPTVVMRGDALGNYFAHVEIPSTQIPPASVTVTNATSNPVNGVTTGVTDLVTVTSATFDTLTNALSVSAFSSDLTAPPALIVEGPLGGALTGGTFSKPVAAGVLPPQTIAVSSSAGGRERADVTILPGLPDNKPFPPVAVADVLTTNSGVPASLDVTANDALTPPALVSQVVVVSAPLNGSAAPIGINTGVVTYTPNAGFSGTDSFQYVLVDSSGAASNVASVTVTVNFLATPPTANADAFAMIQNKSTLVGKVVNVLANDRAAAGTSLNPASVRVVTRPLHGTAVANADGTITYTPVLAFVGADSFTYTVANAQGGVSNVATVSAVVEGGAETISFSKQLYTVSKKSWNIVGSTNWFGPTLLHTTATCWIGKGIAVGALIGTVPVDTAGKFQLVPGPNTTSPPDASHVFTCQTSNGGSISAAVTVL